MRSRFAQRVGGNERACFKGERMISAGRGTYAVLVLVAPACNAFDLFVVSCNA